MATYDMALDSAKPRARRTNATDFIWCHQPEARKDCGSQDAPAMLRVMPDGVAGESGKHGRGKSRAATRLPAIPGW